MTTVIYKETIQRLLKDVKQIIKNPLVDQGIYYVHDDVDMLKGYAMIIGPEDTPYFGGYYFFELKYPRDYPHSPPVVKYCTNGENIRFNPNLYCCGKVCLSILNTWRGDQWTSCQSISTVLLTICSILSNNPLLNEPGVNISHPDVKTYNDIIEYSNINIAVCDIVCKKPGVYMPFFDIFYHHVKEKFLENYEKLVSLAKNRKEEKFMEQRSLTTSFYGLHVRVDYRHIVKKLQSTKEKIE
jgi:ubiquitin-conjugating enzyme E2 Z